MDKKQNNLVKQLLGIVFAVILIWAAFKDANPEKLWQYLQSIQTVYLLPIILVSIAGHVIRAWRWRILLDPLSKEKISLFNVFYAVIIGYAVNIVIPRGGEVARIVSLSRSQKLPWAGILPTMLIDRILDLAALVLLLAVSLVYLPKALSGLTWLQPTGAAMCVLVVVGLVALPFVGSMLEKLLSVPAVKSKIPEKFIGIAQKLAGEFEQGTSALKNPIAYPGIAILSVAIWFSYWLIFYLMIMAFGLTEKVSLINSFLVFTIGSVGVLVPTPGSVGSYHFLVSQALVLTCGIDKDQALAFVSLLHLLTFVLVPPLVAVALMPFAAMRGKETANEKPVVDTAA